MMSGLRSVWILFVGVALLQLGHGLQGSLVSIEASKADFAAATTGVIMSGFSIGLLASSMVTPRIVAAVGHIRVFAAFASIVSTAVLLIPVWVDPFWWFAMRFFAGFCMAGLSIVAESWLNASANNQNRGQLLSIYMIIAYAAVGFGQFLLNVADPSGFVRFIIVSALVSLALVPISLAPAQAPEIESPKPVSLRDIYRASPLAFIGTFAAGLGQQAFFAMGALYGVMQGLSLGYVSVMMALPPLAVILSQYPVGFVSDKYDRRLVLTGLTLLSIVIAVVTWIAGSYSPIYLIGLFSVFGAVSFPIYSLCLAHANDNIETSQMLGASSKLVLIYSAGSVLGPSLAGGVMQQMGAGGLMVFMIAVHGLLGIFAIYRIAARPETAESSHEMMQVVAPSTTPVAAVAMAEEFGDMDSAPENGKSE